jgi:hypothetical protein
MTSRYAIVYVQYLETAASINPIHRGLLDWHRAFHLARLKKARLVALLLIDRDSTEANRAATSKTSVTGGFSFIFFPWVYGRS